MPTQTMLPKQRLTEASCTRFQLTSVKQECPWAVEDTFQLRIVTSNLLAVCCIIDALKGVLQALQLLLARP